MEEIGLSIAVPETILIGFAITVVLCFIILIKVFKTAKNTEDINDEVGEMSEKIARMERALEKIQERKD